ncbi:MAG TPA: hypothetical protein VJT78_11355 [Candidatus Dormibacteraeota bacterium]|nr:hypothetical protein [Candidatus Dormibacteraeota bacterium]
MTGLMGLVLRLNADGTGAVDWSNSQPLLGTYQGRQLKIVLRGTWTLDGVIGDGSAFTATAGTGTFSARFFLGGTAESTYSATVRFGKTTYSCTATTLMTSEPNGSGVSTDTYIRG